MKKFAIVSMALVAMQVASCSSVPGEAYFARGQAESLLSVNSEAVNVDLNARNASAQIASILSGEEASRAVLTCSNSLACQRAESILNQHNLPYEIVEGPTNTLSIVYDRIITRDCDNRFVTNHNNPYNLNHTAFGCSIATNHAMMVRDKRQFTDPLVLGPYDGFKAAQNYDSYLSRNNDDEVIQATQESVSGND